MERRSFLASFVAIIPGIMLLRKMRAERVGSGAPFDAAIVPEDVTIDRRAFHEWFGGMAAIGDVWQVQGANGFCELLLVVRADEEIRLRHLGPTAMTLPPRGGIRVGSSYREGTEP